MNEETTPKKPSLLKSWRIWLIVILLVISFFVIKPQFGVDGVAIVAIEKGSNADQAGIIAPSASLAPIDRERILQVNTQVVNSVTEFDTALSQLTEGDTISIVTSETAYQVTVPFGILVAEPEVTNIRKGIDLQGGTRILLQAERQLDEEELSLLLENMRQRLNAFGLNDIVVRTASDLSDNTFILVEVAGVNKRSAQNLLAQQGKFEGKIGEEVVFSGGNDIVYVCNSATCSGIDPQQGCTGTSPVVCQYRFSITLSDEAAQRHFESLQSLSVVSNSVLSENLSLFLDDELVNTLRIGASLREAPTTEIAISGSGSGNTRQEAIAAALDDMRALQSILITGSLPVKLDIVQVDTISPALGQQFSRNALVIAVAALAAVSLFVLLVYRDLRVAPAIVITSLVEIILLLGVSTFLKQSIDLGAVAGIIAAVGTGVNDQIVITDEALRGGISKGKSWKEKSRNAFFIITGAYLTTAVAMIPLFFAGAGILRGFALVTLIGITIGVFITRPAYAKVLEVLLKKDDHNY